MILYQDPYSHRSFFALYGAFEKECSSFDLYPHANKIEAVMQLKADGVGKVSFVGISGQSFLDDFNIRMW